MATLDQLKTHISTTQTRVEEAQKKAGGAKYDPELRKIKKKYKRLTRKAAKIVYMEKKKEEKTNKKKKGGGE